jgi:hypothetical protein
MGTNRTHPLYPDSRNFSYSVEPDLPKRKCPRVIWHKSIAVKAKIKLLPFLLPLGVNGIRRRKIGCSLKICSLLKFSVWEGSWDRNRTGALRFWSPLPFVRERSGTYTSRLKIAHFDGVKCLEVHQRSPALGANFLGI